MLDLVKHLVTPCLCIFLDIEVLLVQGAALQELSRKSFLERSSACEGDVLATILVDIKGIEVGFDLVWLRPRSHIGLVIDSLVAERVRASVEVGVCAMARDTSCLQGLVLIVV